MTISLRLDDQDAAMIKKYAKLHEISVSEFLRESAMDRIEDEYDLKTYEKAMNAFKDDPVSYSLDDVEKELGFK